MFEQNGMIPRGWQVGLSISRYCADCPELIQALPSLNGDDCFCISWNETIYHFMYSMLPKSVCILSKINVHYFSLFVGHFLSLSLVFRKFQEANTCLTLKTGSDVHNVFIQSQLNLLHSLSPYRSPEDGKLFSNMQAVYTEITY